MPVEVGVEAGSAPVPPSGSGSELSPSALCSQTPTTTTFITTPTPTIRPLRLTIHRPRIIRLHGAVGAPLTVTITLVDAPPLTAADDLGRPRKLALTGR